MKHTVAMLLVLLMAVIGLTGCSEDDVLANVSSSQGGSSSSSGVAETTSNYTFDGNIATLRDAITSTTAQTFNITVSGIVHARKRAGEFWIQDRNAGILVYSSRVDYPEIGSRVTLTATAGLVYNNLKEVTDYIEYSVVSTGNAIYRQTGIPSADKQGQAWKTDKVLTPAGWATKSNIVVDGITYRNDTGAEIPSDAYRIVGPVSQFKEEIQVVILQGGATVWSASSSAASSSSSSGPVVIGNVDRYFWGKWTRMDTGDVYHITDKSVTVNSGSAQTVGGASATSISFGGQTLTKDSENVARLGATALLFRNGGARRAFTARLTGFAAAAGMPGRSGQMRIGIGDNPIGNRPTGRTNAGNPADNQTVTSGTDGLVSYTNAVAGDSQVVTVGGGSGQPVVVTVNPEFDGQDIGTIPVVEDGYSFKVTSKVTVSDSGYLYGNNFNTYSVTVDIKNIGNARCLTSLYEVIPDAGLTVASGALTGNFSSIEVGAARTLTFGVRYGSLTEEYKDVKLTIKITDAATERTWVDYVVLRFHKRPVPLKISSQNLDGVNTATLKGFVVHPDNRSARFTVPSNGSAMLYVPWSSRPYQMVFSGAGADTEMKYSFVVGTATTDLGGTWSIPDINAYESNNSEAAKTIVTDGWVSRRAYLNVEDIDFYSLDLTAMPGTVPLPTAADVPDSAYGVAPDVTGTTSGSGVVTLTFSGNGHTGGTVPVAVSGTTGWVVTLPEAGDLVKTGMTFVGWYNGNIYQPGTKLSLSATTVLYAMWMDMYGLCFSDFVSVPSGTFTQETTDGGSFSHTITGIKMGKYEVTYELWYTVRQWAVNNGFFMRQGREGNNGGEGVAPTSAKFEPVTKITWQDIIVWSNAYSKMRGYKEAYYSDSGLTTAITNVGEPNIANPYVDWNATGYRLPTEGEWQYAASYKDGTDWTPYNYASGATAAYTDATATGLVAWYSANSGTTPANRSTQPVGTLKPNALGLHDMSGNVWEWCWDWSGTLPATTQTDYRGPVSGTARILRGGSHYDSEVSIGYRWPKASNNEVMSYPVNVFHQGGLRLAQKQ